MAESAMLADIQQMVYPRGHPSTARYGVDQGRFAGQRPTFQPLCYATNKGGNTFKNCK